MHTRDSENELHKKHLRAHLSFRSEIYKKLFILQLCAAEWFQISVLWVPPN